jgi:2-polyprenyl-6-hydroxyphenyl methylase/3-demethylubiquinone-9 3-methyltransferase
MLGRRKRRGRVLPGDDAASADRRYAADGWESLRGLRELARYGVIAGYCAHLRARSVLDVGCGEGLLAERLLRPPSETYVGVELSAVAVEVARAKGLPGDVRFEAGRAETYAPTRRFDVVVFNELLYYFEAPEAVALRYAAWLEPNGAIVVSMHRKRTGWAWRRLERALELVDAVAVRHDSGVVWDVKLLRPREEG